MTDHELVKTCVNRIFKQLGFENTDHLAQRDFEYFCNEIEAKTGILISLSTAKRLLNGQFSKLPQIATLNAIANYLGYDNWQKFKHEIKASSHQGSRTIETATVENNVHNYHPVRFSKKKIATLTVVLLVMFFLIAFVNRSIGKKGSFKKATFSAKKITANNLPNTVVFNYNVDDIDADSFFIQQSWDKNRRVKVYKNQYAITDIYYEPGYHIAKLIADEKIIKTFDVSIPTDRWFFYAKAKAQPNTPEYINKSPASLSQSLSLTREDLKNNQVDVTEEKEYIFSYFPSKLKINSEDFILTTKIKRTGVRNDRCPYIMLEVFCQKNFMFFKTMPPGCSGESIAQFGENFLSGKKNDLSSLGADPGQWLNFEWVVKKKEVEIFLNGKNVFQTSYNNPSGLITGLGFISNGLCEIDFVELKGSDGQLFYSWKKPGN